jgi:hypothetical protein
MAEQLYTIPVNDAFREDCECPLCKLTYDLERNAIEYTLGPSYMEDDNRAMTDRLWFCSTHARILYGEKNRLGLALMMKTHTDKTIADLKKLSKTKPTPSGFLKKNKTQSPVGSYIRELEDSCFICERMNRTLPRYIDTVFHLWKKDPEFVDCFKACKGFCTYHYGLLFEAAADKLSKAALDNFIDTLNQVYFTNMERVNQDVSWFIDKFDYRFKDEPWKNSKDALPRGLTKTNHTIIEE